MDNDAAQLLAGLIAIIFFCCALFAVIRLGRIIELLEEIRALLAPPRENPTENPLERNP